MKLIATMLAWSLVLAAAHAAIAVLALAILLTLLWGLYARTAQTIGYLFVCGLFWFASAQPKWALAIMVATMMIIAFRWANHIESDPSTPFEDDR